MSYALQSNQGWTMGLFAILPAPLPWIVTTTNDSSDGSLRAAITRANANPGPVTTGFAIPGASPHTITLASALPIITANDLTIDGTSQAGTQCRTIWNCDAHILRVNARGSTSFDRFRLAGSRQTVGGLSVPGFANSFALLAGSTSAAVRCNFIGTDPTGMSARANGTGINNFFGNVTWRDITRNLISGNNGNAGIMLEADDWITPSTDQIRIQRNRIGFNRTLTALLGNGGDGICFDAGGICFDAGSITNVLIGALAATQGDKITGNVNALAFTTVTNINIGGNIIARAVQHSVRLAGQPP